MPRWQILARLVHLTRKGRQFRRYPVKEVFGGLKQSWRGASCLCPQIDHSLQNTAIMPALIPDSFWSLSLHGKNLVSLPFWPGEELSIHFYTQHPLDLDLQSRAHLNTGTLHPWQRYRTPFTISQNRYLQSGPSGRAHPSLLVEWPLSGEAD